MTLCNDFNDFCETLGEFQNFEDFIDAQEDEETGSGERSEDQDSDAPSSPDRLSLPDRPASEQIGPPHFFFLGCPRTLNHANLPRVVSKKP